MIDGYAEPARADLLARILETRAVWEELVARAGGRLTEPGAAGEWSVKDVIAHICAYERFALSLLGGRVRDLPPMPRDVEMSVEKRNAWLHSLDRDRSIKDVLAEARDVHNRLVEQIRSRSQEELRAPPVTWSNWPAWRWVIDDTFDHYEQHIPSVRTWLDERRG